ncbi:hypothetical protein Goari_015229 [Gossypium aridum]|uniref:Uncharacterized protein n=1 Tax=Gossypium aridum TaxID=34290 RepID=A0A7J8XKA1_GOSAI|nr:hypothetical protein [Gossypium aridum]
MAHLWKQGSPLHHICANLETPKVSECDSPMFGAACYTEDRRM